MTLIDDVKPARRILLVDDSISVLVLYSRVLENAGFVVSKAENGSEALKLLDSEAPDLIILDCKMPGISGVDLLTTIRGRAELAHVPVIFLTASGDEEGLVNRAFELGVNDYITKPVNRNVIVARVTALIAQTSARSGEGRAAAVFQQHEELLEEVGKAKTLQRNQLPRLPLRWPGWHVSGVLEPCSQVGGDLFDIVEGVGEIRTVVFIDVSGHGVAAAMVASAVRAILRILVRTVPFELILAELNRQLIENAEEHYACVALVQIGPHGVWVANAGLPPIVFITAGRVVAEIMGSGPPPGLVADAEYSYESRISSECERIVLVSDGLTEPFGSASNVAPYLEALRLLAGRDELIEDADSLQAHVTAIFGNGAKQEDDATIVVLDQLLDPLPSRASSRSSELLDPELGDHVCASR